MIMGHMDTVNATGWHERWPSGPLSDPFSGYYDEHYLYGRGSADQKGGIASAVAAVKALRDADVRLAGTVVLAFLVDEESGEKDTGVSAGAKALVDDILSGTVPRPNFAIYTEPTALKLYTSQMGFIVGEDTVVGKTSYFGTPWLGKDAIRDVVLLLDALYKHSDEISSRTHDKLGNAFLLVTEIQGGGYIAVPGKCVINFIRKVLPSESLQSGALAIESLLADLNHKYSVSVNLRYTASRDNEYGGTPMEVDDNAPGVDLLVKVVRNTTNIGDPIGGAPYWSEASFLVNQLHVDCVYFGPGDISYCHTPDEKVKVSDVKYATRVLYTYAAEFCGVKR